MINPPNKQVFTSKGFSHYSHSLKLIILGCYCKVFSVMFIRTFNIALMLVVALLLIVYVVIKPESGLLSFSSAQTPEKFVSLNFRAGLS